MTRFWRDIPFSKGFVLTQKEFDGVAHYEKTRLPGGWALWSDSAVDTDVAISGDDFFIIRGHWVDTGNHGDERATARHLLTSLVQESEDQFHRRLGLLGGRFVIIVKHSSRVWVYNDATGLRSVYYSRVSPLVASHLHLLAILQPEDPKYSRKSTMKALDETPFSKIRQLLPNFRLDPVISKVERFFPFENNRFLKMLPNDRLQAVEKLWRKVMEHYIQHTNKLTLSITGGLDSKLMLAMCSSDSEYFTAYTYGVSHGSDSRAESLSFDVKQVKTMLPYLELKSHEFLDVSSPKPLTGDIKALIRKNTWGTHGPYLVPMYRRMFPGDGWYHLRGNGVEIIRRFWPNQARNLGQRIQHLQHPEGPAIEERAKDLGYDQYQFGYDLSDLLYWEIRMGKWHAEILNEQDAAFETFLPISVREIYELLLAFPESQREEARTVLELINRNNPLLNFWGTNDSKNIYEQWRDEKNKTKESDANLNQNPSYSLPWLDFSLPKDEFRAGNSNRTTIFVADEGGSLSFVVDQPYRKRQGEGYFEWNIRLDDKIVVRCDGAVTMTPTTITIWNIARGQQIDLEIRAHRDGSYTSDSWERASRLEIQSVIFRPRSVDGDEKLAVGTDNPYASVYEP